jgi:hypothetical protein
MQEKFDKFHSENPHIYSLMSKYAHQLLHAGKKKLSISLIAERVRWDSAVSTVGDSYKLNNNYSALYSRKLENDYPELRGMFGKRVRRA